MRCSFTRFAAITSIAAAMMIAASSVSHAEADPEEKVTVLPAVPAPPTEASLLTSPSSMPTVPSPPTSSGASMSSGTLMSSGAMMSPAMPAAGCGCQAPNVTDGCCGTCDAESFCCRHLIATAEAVWLAPCENQRTGSFQIFNGRNSVEEFSAASATNEGLIATPRIMLGIQGECWGVQMRYWRMEENRNINATDFLDGTGPVTTSGFFAETLDLEMTRLLDICDSRAQFSFGVRYGQFNQSTGVYAQDFVNGDYFAGSALADLNFSGVGITSSLSGLKPVGCSNFNLFYSFRASVLWDGSPTNYVQTTANYSSAINGISGAFNAARASGSGSNLFIGEVQLGGQWNFALKCLPADAFIRTAFEYQYWAANDTGDAQALSFAGPFGGPTVGVSTARSSDAFVNLVGFNVGTGITW